jgi:asparagine synthase (glutamine-hydrolysing)
MHVLGHRGPDAEGLKVIPETNTVLAFRRLSIIDLATGDQPMSTDFGHHIVFNGEIYNYQAARDQMVKDGKPLHTRSDTEVLLWRMADEGPAGLRDLVGMFAFAFLDVPRRSLLLARDRLGVKQLYYANTPDGLFFASEPKALLALPWIQAELSVAELPAYFAFRTVASPATLFRGINKLPPGTALRFGIDDRTLKLERYWNLPEAVTNPSDEGLDEFEALFLDSVRLRLVSDVPLGAFLSGGLDSSLVVAAMRRLGHKDLNTFSATFPGSPDDEASFAQRTSARFHTRHHEEAIAPARFLECIPEWVELNDDLVADASALPLLAVSKLARRGGCIVMLSGEGADELFGGYGSYHKFAILHVLHRILPLGLRNGLLRGLTAIGRLDGQDLPRVREYLVRGGAYMGTAALLGEADLHEVLEAPAWSGDPTMARASGHRLADLGAFDFVTRIPDDLLVRTDRATMGASIEARVPYLDHRLVELAFRLAPRKRSLPGMSKLLLRRLALRWNVPLQTIVHRKIGFQLPLGEWFRNELAPFWQQVLRERVVPAINYDWVARIGAAHLSRQGQFEELMWRIAALELWYRRWVKGEPVLTSASPRDLVSQATPVR